MSAWAACSVAALIDGRLRHVLVFHQHLGALQLQIRIDLRCLGLGEIGRLLIDCSFVGVRFDAEQQVAGLTICPSVKLRCSMKPVTRATMSTLLIATTRPTKSAGVRHLTACHGAYRDGSGAESPVRRLRRCKSRIRACQLQLVC